jgi:Kelch motif
MRFNTLLTATVLATLGLETCWAQSPGSFSTTGRTIEPRASHSATLLANGKVLIAGGSTGSGVLQSAELYDPQRDVFTPAGNMITPRYWHSSTLLPNGKVLIAGGSAGGIVKTKTAELYDPATGSFVATGSMIGIRQCHQGHLLKNGKVLLVGGSFDGPTQGPVAELYDPIYGTLSAVGDYIDTHWSALNTCQGAASTTLPDGRVLIAWEGGWIDIYDPSLNTFAHAGPPCCSGGYNDGLPTVTLLMNGKVLLAGGADDSGIRTTAQIYDPATGVFTRTGNMATPRADHSASLLPDGRVLIAGSSVFGGTTRASAELYDPGSGTFSSAGDMTIPRCCHTSTLLNDGRVLTVGAPFATSVTELYSPRALTTPPVLLTLTREAAGQGAILHAGKGEIVNATNPASSGAVLEIYATGLTQGSAIPPQVAIGGRLVEVLYFGPSNGTANFYQINVRLHSGVAPGQAIPVRLTYLGRSSNEVSIGVR